jgi:hypothetical protein
MSLNEIISDNGAPSSGPFPVMSDGIFSPDVTESCDDLDSFSESAIVEL